MELLIETQGLGIVRQGFQVLEDVHVHVPLGKTTFILGPVGSGKSTLIKAIAGIVLPDAGRVEVLGKDYRDMSPTEDRIFRSSAAFVFQDGALWANQTIWNNLAIPLRHHHPAMRIREFNTRIREALDKVGFVDDPQARPSSLSTGEQKLVAFARALVLRPQILFMDEPTSFMDEAGVRRLEAMLRSLASEGKTMVAVGNKYELAFRIADHVCILYEGKVYAEGSLFDMTDRWPAFLEPIQSRHLKLIEQRINRSAQPE